MSRFITQVVLCGANRPYNVALIVPDWDAIRSELKVDLNEEQNSNNDASMEAELQLMNDERVPSLLAADIAEKCKGLKKFEIPRNFACVAPFTAANNMITPKMSIRRHVVMDAYEDLIDSMYTGRDVVGHSNSSTSSSIPA